MTPRIVYLSRAEAAYEQYMELQRRITNIEANAKHRYDGNEGVAGHHLKTASEYWKYRDLVSDRNVKLEIATINALLAVAAGQ